MPLCVLAGVGVFVCICYWLGPIYETIIVGFFVLRLCGFTQCYTFLCPTISLFVTAYFFRVLYICVCVCVIIHHKMMENKAESMILVICYNKQSGSKHLLANIPLVGYRIIHYKPRSEIARLYCGSNF